PAGSTPAVPNTPVVPPQPQTSVIAVSTCIPTVTYSTVTLPPQGVNPTGTPGNGAPGNPGSPYASGTVPGAAGPSGTGTAVGNVPTG
ncbi:hypothetical protein KEM55_008729, partial [Ascosphaera atra]